MSATETWAMDIEDITRQVMRDEIQEALVSVMREQGVTSDDLVDAVNTAIEEQGLVTADGLEGEVSDAINNMSDDITYNVVNDYSFNTAVSDAMDEWAYDKDYADAGDVESLSVKVQYLEDWAQKRDEGESVDANVLAVESRVEAAIERLEKAEARLAEYDKAFNALAQRGGTIEIRPDERVSIAYVPASDPGDEVPA